MTSPLLDTFTESFKNAIDIEQLADLTQTEELLKKYGPKKLTQLGLAVNNLLVSGVKTGLGGKSLLELQNDPAISSDVLTTGSIKVGDIVRVSSIESSSSKDKTNDDSSALSLLAVVMRIAQKTITLAIDKDVSDDDDKVLSFYNDSVRVWIVKLTNSVTYKRMLSTMNKLQEKIDGKNGGLGGNTVVDLLLGNTRYVAPSSLDKRSTKTKFFDNNLNELQKKAIDFALESPITIIHGPPGTGKTYTLIEIIKQLSLIRNERVLVCGPSNISVDTILERLSKVFSNEVSGDEEGASNSKSKRKRKQAENQAKLPPEKLIRIGHPARLLSSNLNHSLDVLSKETPILGDIYKEISDTLYKVKKTKRYSERRALWGELKTLRKELREREKKLTLDLLIGAKVVLLTLHGSGSYELTSLYSKSGDEGDEQSNTSFDTIIIDEVSQALEPQCWIPLINHYHFKRLIIAGDNMQLPPTVKSRDHIDFNNNQELFDTASYSKILTSVSKKMLDTKITCAKRNIANLERTLFDRLMEDHDGAKFKLLLDTQYRMNETIMRFPSDELYNGYLKADASVANISLADLLPMSSSAAGEEIPSTLWFDTQGGEFMEKSTGDNNKEIVSSELSGSKYNEMEAEVCKRHIKLLADKIGIPTSKIGVISPYSAQVSLLKSMLHEKYPELEISTVDGFQGREKEIIILSLVRSNDNREVGFLRDKRRLNVAITRPKRHLCIIGDLGLMQQSGIPFLKNWADFAEANYEIEYPQIDEY